MAKIQFTKFLHDDLSVEENIDHLSELPDDAARDVAGRRPWYEVCLHYEYDTETNKATFLRLSEEEV